MLGSTFWSGVISGTAEPLETGTNRSGGDGSETHVVVGVQDLCRPLSAQQHPNSGRVALDSTFFERGHASHYYLKRADRTI